MSKSEELKGQSHLVRTVAATLDIRVPDDTEKQFRATLLRKATAEINTISTVMLIRLFESACGVEFADPDVIEFRHACERILAGHLDLAKYKAPRAAAKS